MISPPNRGQPGQRPKNEPSYIWLLVILWHGLSSLYLSFYFFFVHESRATAILIACLSPRQGLFNCLVFMSPKVRNAKRLRRGENLTWRQAFIKAYMSRGERRRTGRNLSSGNIRTGSRVSAWKQRVQRTLKSLLPRTNARDMRSNESNARTTTNDQSSTNPK